MIDTFSGKQFHELTIISEPFSFGKGRFVKIKCSCGKEREFPLRHILTNRIISCSCISKRRGAESRHYKGYKNLSSKTWHDIIRNAKSRNLEFSISIEYAYSLLEKQNFRCALSNIEIKLEPSQRAYEENHYNRTAPLDRIDSTKGYVENNIQWIHKDISDMKMDKDEKDFF